MAVAPAFGMILVVVMAIIVPLIVLLVLGLSNRHTRGATKGVAIALGVMIGLVMLWRMAAVPTRMQTSSDVTFSFSSQEELDRKMAEHYRAEASRSPIERQRLAHLQDQIAHFEQLAENLEHSADSEASRQVAQQYRTQAEQLRMQLVNQRAATPQANFGGDVSWAAMSPVGVLVVFAVIVFLLFKHAGPTVGFAALAIPVVLLMVSYSSYHVREDDRQLAQARLDMMGEQVAHEIRGNDLDSIIVSSPDESRAHGEISMDDEQSKQEKPLENRGDESTEESPIAQEAPLPDWVKVPPKSVPNVYRRVVESKWQSSAVECQRVIDSKIERAILDYLSGQVAKEGGAGVPSLDTLAITSDFIRENVVADEFYRTKDFDLDTDMTNLYVLLEIDSMDDHVMVSQWRDYARIHRISWVRNLMLGVMVSLAGVLGLIKVDTATKGYYTKRLFIGVPAAIIGIGLLLAILGIA